MSKTTQPSQVRTWEEHMSNHISGFSEQWEVVYDAPDEHGYWGRRLRQMFVTRDKGMHEEVRARFQEEMKGQIFKIYQIVYC